MPETHDIDPSRPLSIEQAVTCEIPGEPRISPDGTRIAFTVSPVSKAGAHRLSTIWIAGFDHGEPQPFTSGLWNDRSPRWSPDGTRIAFLSDRAERGRYGLYVAALDGGEARRVLYQEGRPTAPEWSPGGETLTVLITDHEPAGARNRGQDDSDATVWDTSYRFQRLWSLDPATQQAIALSPEGVQVWSYAWAPDGGKIAINTTTTPRINDTYNDTEVSIVTPDGTRIASAFRLTGVAEDMVWSTDGRSLAYRSASGKAVTGDTVYHREIEGGTKHALTPDYPGTAGHLAPIGAGDALLFTGIEGLDSVIYRLEWDGSRRRLTADDQTGHIDGPPTASKDGSRIAAIRQDITNPPQVWAFERGHTSRRTSFNPELDQAAIGAPEIVRWHSDPGVEVEGILYKPHGYQHGRRYPLVVCVHGGPTWLWANVFHAGWRHWGAILAARGIAVLLPNPRGSTGRGSEYLNALFGDVGGNEYRDMMSGVDAMIGRGIADGERLGIGGWSWGGYMTAWAITQSDRFKAAVVGAGLPNLIADNSLGNIPSANLSYFEKSAYEDPDSYYERSPIRYISNVKTPTLVLHGEADPEVATAQGIEMYVALRQIGVETQLVTYPREGHYIYERKHQTDLLQCVIGWYERLLLGKDEPE